MSQVADELTASRAAHARYRNAAGRIDIKGDVAETKRHDACRLALQDAYDHRMAADALDPKHDDPDWANDVKATHDQLVQFYAAQLARYAA
jgi:hypothetical protein